MARTQPLPKRLGASFRVADALAAGVGRGRLRGPDLERPFHGIRSVSTEADESLHPLEERRQRILERARAFASMLREDQFFSHETAALIWGAPVPLRDERVHVSVAGDRSLPRRQGVVAHRVRPEMTSIRTHDGLPVSSPAATWAMLGRRLAVADLVALGDFFCRVWRAGHGRPDVGRQPLTAPDQLATALAAGRRPGAPRLREALALVRTDSWSPRESATRCALVQAGLPEPELNQDIWSSRGEFLGCVDLSYPEARIAIEYQGELHASQYAVDVERIARLRAEGWIVIEVTKELLARPAELVDRVRRALRSRGCAV
ncbi:endonuclease domain-containing protein [Microbacterium sp. gxy059]|uniref:endonuclease domain-containing protein n=1 Tax=Microbacterium sp. gxy059 TaxID=2957199 RepID=UPI003D9982C4